MTYEEYLEKDKPEHGAVVVWWKPMTSRPYARVFRCTYHHLTRWSCHPWSKDGGRGEDFEDQWEIEAGDSVSKLTGTGRSSQGWRELCRMVEDDDHFTTRRAALDRAAYHVSAARAYHEGETRRLRDEESWIETEIENEIVGGALGESDR